jgi:hypothetical protein
MKPVSGLLLRPDAAMNGPPPFLATCFGWNYTVGAVCGECARSLMREQQLSPGDVEVIGYDGQTIYQEPAERPRV